MTKIVASENVVVAVCPTDEWQEDICVAKGFYGQSKTKPNDHCFWGVSGRTDGWIETDGHFRKRIKSIQKEIREYNDR